MISEEVGAEEVVRCKCNWALFTLMRSAYKLVWPSALSKFVDTLFYVKGRRHL
jgi:hypothetical protein